MIKSKINSKIDLNYLTCMKENLYFDRKKSKISLQDIANVIASFANSNGGVLAIGICDDGKLEGFNSVGIEKLNDVQKVINNFLSPSPIVTIELLDIKNYNNEEDIVVLYHIEPSFNEIIYNNKREVFCRQGDSTFKLNSDQIRSLEYNKGKRDFESEIAIETSVKDIDEEIVELYKRKLNYESSFEELLRARGFLKKYKDKECLTKAGLLLFGKNPSVFLPNARLRVLKFEGVDFQVGTEMNIVKDKTFDKCLYKIIGEASEFINSQLREFTKLNKNGIFETIPEYPKFAWYEGLINALTHRDYSNYGEHITIKLYDDRMEILSPGKLSGYVTLDNMQVTRHSRNPQIARVLSELEIVRELNEGIKRIYSEMERFYLKEPIFSEPNKNSFLLVLDNNIIMRGNRKKSTLLKSEKISSIWNSLSFPEQQILQCIHDKGDITSAEASEIIDRGKTTTVRILNNLINLELIVWTGTAKNDNSGKYILKENN